MRACVCLCVRACVCMRACVCVYVSVCVCMVMRAYGIVCVYVACSGGGSNDAVDGHSPGSLFNEGVDLDI